MTRAHIATGKVELALEFDRDSVEGQECALFEERTAVLYGLYVFARGRDSQHEICA